MKEQTKYIILWSSIIISAIILWLSLYFVEKSKSQSIERQKNQEYLLERSEECYKIYKEWEKMFGNIIYASRDYDRDQDKCIIKNINGKTSKTI